MMYELTNITYIKALLERHGFRFSKSLGQNFLTSEHVVDSIIDSASVTEEDVVLEIGPGIGSMTRKMAERARKVISIEIDSALLPLLQETLSPVDNVEIISGDVLKVDLESIDTLGIKPKIIANLPYYITTPIIMRFLESKYRFESMTIMMQKEVADRIVAEPGNKTYGALSASVQYYCDVEKVINVPRGVFIPSPNVDSAVIRLTPVKRDIELKDEDLFFRVVKAAFSSRRKTLLNSLSNHFEKEKVKVSLEKAGIDAKRRGETLNLNEFAALSNEFYNSDL